MNTTKSNSFNRVILTIKKLLGINTILCDSCKWDWRSACHNSERPNAESCADYRRKGS